MTANKENTGFEIHLTKKDFKLEWFSGTGAGGQHRNKHQNCCRITHIESRLRAQGTGFRERVRNQEEAFNKLARMVIAFIRDSKGDCKKRAPSDDAGVIRNYNEARNEVHDKASGHKEEYKKIMKKGLDSMINARREGIPSNDR